MAIEFKAYETEQVVFLGHAFDLKALTRSQIAAEQKLDAKFEAAQAAIDEDDTDDAAKLDESIDIIAQRLNARTTPAVDAKSRKGLGTMVKEAWASNDQDYFALAKFAGQVLEIDPFGESATEPEGP